MSTESLEIVKHMNIASLDTQMAIHCAPVICGIKPSNLFIIDNKDLHEAVNIMEEINLSYLVLQISASRTTFLLYDKYKLSDCIFNNSAKSFLKELGYRLSDLTEVLSQFRNRYKSYQDKSLGYPHEIGIFLGYPMEDVLGFIENSGENSIYTGYWKVYDKLPQKLRIFNFYECAQNRVLRLVASGRRIADIAALYEKTRLPIAAV